MRQVHLRDRGTGDLYITQSVDTDVTVKKIKTDSTLPGPTVVQLAFL